ncbi:MAG TPA: prepilin-type N-terminal cleavage/methylation domain-containing protein [Dongiaceae bacterium]|nr:prepilin-type N-terminal cleavage/methylation domain-containing protein [Dongiaceae bacterium]
MADVSKCTPLPLRQRRAGFTIVELLIVIVVIAILAAIVIVTYNGIKRRTVEATMQTDLEQSAKLVENDKTLTGNYPATAAAANSGQGLKSSGNNTLTYYAKSYGYCIYITNTATPTVYSIRSTNISPTANGNCSDIPSVVTTFAGNGTAGAANGVGTAAQFNNPWGITADAGGNVYVSEQGNSNIRKIDTSANVTTFAGAGIAGYVDATGTSAKFYNPWGVAVDTSGNIFVADYNNNRIRAVSPSAVVTTLAGSGTATYADGTGTAASFNQPAGIAVDSSGNVYIGDYANNRIRKITPGGVVTTLAGSTVGYVDATGTSAKFYNPWGVAVDTSGNVYVADTNNNRIRKITPGGVVTTLAGSGTAAYADGTGTAASFNWPIGIAVDTSGNVYVGDTGNNRIRMITPAGVVTTIAGSGTAGHVDATGTAAQFYAPRGVAVDGAGNLYVAEYSNYIRKITP